MNATFPWRSRRSLQDQDIKALHEIRRNSLPANYRDRRLSSASQLASDIELWHKPNIFMKGAAVPNSVVRNATKMEEMRVMHAKYDRSYNQDTVSGESVPLELNRVAIEERTYPQTQDEMLRTRLEILDDADKELEREESEQSGELHEATPTSGRKTKDYATKSKRSPTAESILRSIDVSAFSLKPKTETVGRTHIKGTPSPSPEKNDITQETGESENDITDGQFREIYNRIEEPQLFKDESVDNRLIILEEKEDVKQHKKAPSLKFLTRKIFAEAHTDKTGTKRTNVAFQSHEDTHDKNIAKRSKLDGGSIIESSDSFEASKSEASALQSATQVSTPDYSATESTIGKESETASISSSSSDKPAQKDQILPTKLRLLAEFNNMKRQKAARTPKETLQKMVHRVEREVNRRLAFASANVSKDNEISTWLGLNQRGVSRAPTLDSIASVSQELIELFKSPSIQKEDDEETASLDKNKENKSPAKRKVRLDANKESIASVEIPLEYGFIEPRKSTDHEKTNQGKVDPSRRRRSVTQELGTPLLTEKKHRTTKVGSQNTEIDKRVTNKQPAKPKTNLVDKYVQEKEKRKKTHNVTKPGKQKDVAFAGILLQKEKAREVTPGFPVDIWDD